MDKNKSKEVVKYVSLDDVLGREVADLTAVVQGEFVTRKIGVIPFTAVTFDETKQIKKDCMVLIPDPNGTKGRMVPDLDEDKMAVRVIIKAVDKDDRSNFTFAKKELLAKLGVSTADAVVAALLSPGEIMSFAGEVQEASGYGQQAQKETEAAVKN